MNWTRCLDRTQHFPCPFVQLIFAFLCTSSMVSMTWEAMEANLKANLKERTKSSIRISVPRYQRFLAPIEPPTTPKMRRNMRCRRASGVVVPSRVGGCPCTDVCREPTSTRSAACLRLCWQYGWLTSQTGSSLVMSVDHHSQTSSGTSGTARRQSPGTHRLQATRKLAAEPRGELGGAPGAVRWVGTSVNVWRLRGTHVDDEFTRRRVRQSGELIDFTSRVWSCA